MSTINSRRVNAFQEKPEKIEPVKILEDSIKNFETSNKFLEKKKNKIVKLLRIKKNFRKLKNRLNLSLKNQLGLMI